MATTQRRLNLDCIAADSSSTYLYGIASAEGRDGRVHTVLVKSNASPSSLATTTWTIVSLTPGEELSYGYPKFLSVDCAVSTSGAFSAFFRAPSTWSTRMYDMHPMGLRYDPIQDKWFSIRGARMYQWVFDRVVHKSFYLGETVVHTLTQDYSLFVKLGVVDTECNVLQLAGSWSRDITSGFQVESMHQYIYQPWYDRYYNLTRTGFFSRGSVDTPALLAFGDNNVGSGQRKAGLSGRFYFGHSSKNSIQSYTFDSAMAPPILDANLEGPAEMPFGRDYLFSGLRGNVSFVGWMGGDGKRYHLNTAELLARSRNSWNSTIIHHNLTRNDFDTTSNGTWIPPNYIVNENFVTVGGRSAGQEPFVVALTSDGLYEFGLFGNASATSTGAGIMKGPFYVDIPSSTFVSNQPYRMFDPVDNTGERAWRVQPDIILILFLSFPALVSMVALFRYLRPRWIARVQRKTLERELNGPGEGWFKTMMVKTIGVKPPVLETYPMGIIPERQVVDYFQRHGTTSAGSGRGGEGRGGGMDASAISYQEEIRGLELSSHPRPNVVTSIGDS